MDKMRWITDQIYIIKQVLSKNNIFRDMKCTILCLVFLFWLDALSAQFHSAEIGISGLTCSACSRSVEMSLRKLPFIDSVSMNLEHANAKVFFKKISIVEIEKLAQAVVDAGFSVTYLNADFTFKNTAVGPDFCFLFENNIYQFLIPEAKTLNGKVILNFIGDKYLSKKDFSKWKPKMMEVCNRATHKKQLLYYVTL
jgi:copper chaperone CopZ